MAQPPTEAPKELTRNREAGWHGFLLFSKISIVVVVLLLIFLALVTL